MNRWADRDGWTQAAIDNEAIGVIVRWARRRGEEVVDAKRLTVNHWNFTLGSGDSILLKAEIDPESGPTFRMSGRIAKPESIVRGARFIDLIVLPIPAAQRLRYREEFRAELWDLKREGASRWKRARYLATLANLIFEIRREVRQPERTVAKP